MDGLVETEQLEVACGFDDDGSAFGLCYEAEYFGVALFAEDGYLCC